MVLIVLHVLTLFFFKDEIQITKIPIASTICEKISI